MHKKLLSSTYILSGLLLFCTTSVILADPSVALTDTVWSLKNGHTALTMMDPCQNCVESTPLIAKTEHVYSTGCFNADPEFPYQVINFYCRKMQCDNGFYYKRTGDSYSICTYSEISASCAGADTCIRPPSEPE